MAEYGQRTTNEGVCEEFCKGNPAESDHLYTNGKWIKSYSLILAEWGYGKIHWRTTHGGHSVTTSRHVHQLERAIARSGKEVVAVGTDSPRLHSDD